MRLMVAYEGLIEILNHNLDQKKIVFQEYVFVGYLD